MTGASRNLGRRGLGYGLLLSVLLFACHRNDDTATSSTPAPSARPPLDRLAPGELVPGDTKAFSLVLPRDVKIDQAFNSVIFASGPVSASDLSNYVRSRIVGGNVSVGATATVFDQVKPADDPKLSLSIRIFPGPMGRGAHIEVRNVTPPPLPDLPSTAERWKQFGLSPDGRVLDPQHLR